MTRGGNYHRDFTKERLWNTLRELDALIVERNALRAELTALKALLEKAEAELAAARATLKLSPPQEGTIQ